MHLIQNIFRVRPLPVLPSSSLMLLRIVAGLAMMIHGWSKIQAPLTWMGPDSGVPGFLLLLAAVSEFGGGLAWILGLLTPLASLGMTFTMLGAVGGHLFVWGDPFIGGKGGGSYELSAIYLCISILIGLMGPGRFALDRLLFGEKQ